MSFADDIANMFGQEITCLPGVLDGSGAWVAFGDPVTLPCRYEGSMRTTRDLRGVEQVSTLQALILGAPALRPDTWRFTIDARYTPNVRRTAVAVVPEVDEDGGTVYVEVQFP